MVPPEIGHLVTLGLEKDVAEVYVELLSVGATSADQLAELTGRLPAAVRGSFAALVDAGLVSVLSADRSSVAPVAPETGLDLLTRRREMELHQARISMINAFASFHRSAADDGVQHLIEIVAEDVVAARISQLERAASNQILGLDSPPYYADANQLELDNLARGVGYRVVYATGALERADYLADNVIPAVRAGEEARTLPEVPVKMMIFDRECAVVSASASETTVGGALLIRPCSLLSAMIGLFEMCWRAALPFDIRDRLTGSSLQPSEQRLLGLLAAGLTDEQVIRALRISRRTLFRYLEGLTSRTGAANRFQLALYAVRNGWI